MIRIIRSWFTKMPNKEFGWSPQDFTKAKKWAKSRPHPEISHLTLWDYVSTDWYDSEYKLSIINMYLKEELKNAK